MSKNVFDKPDEQSEVYFNFFIEIVRLLQVDIKDLLS